MAQRVGRDIALLFHDRGTGSGWVVSSTLRQHFTPGKDPVPIVQGAGWAPGPVWTVAENLVPTGIRSRTVQPVVSHYTNWATWPIYIYIYIYMWKLASIGFKLNTLQALLPEDGSRLPKHVEEEILLRRPTQRKSAPSWLSCSTQAALTYCISRYMTFTQHLYKEMSTLWQSDYFTLRHLYT